MIDWRTIDWSNPDAKISRHFTVKEALWLHHWNRLANEADGLNDHVKAQILRMAEKMDVIRDFIGLPINVHDWYRPEKYNADPRVKGAKRSKHMCLGDHSAVDWDAPVDGAASEEEACDILRASLEPKLEPWEIRMEKNPGAPWVHTDNAEVVLLRYFRP